MLCTNCSKIVKPIVAVDIDGTMGDYHGHFLNFALAYMGRPEAIDWMDPVPYTGRIKFSEWFTEYFNVSLEEFRRIKLAYRQGGQKRSMPIYRGAADMVKSFREAGAEVWITTTRPYLRIDNIDPDTRAWLSRHEIDMDGLVYDDFKYEQLAEMIDPTRVAAVVEDLREYVDEASRVFHCDCVLWRRTGWNRGFGSGGYSELSEITAAGVKLIERWKQENE